MTEQWDGRPENPERDGWHWVAGPDGKLPVAVIWHGPTQHWVLGAIGMPPSSFAGANYLGPCLTPAEVTAREAAARREGIEAAIEKAAQYPEENGACRHTAAGVLGTLRALLEDGR